MNILKGHIDRCITSGKRVYTTRKQVLGLMNIVSKRDNVKLRYYKCKHCRGFHLTSKELYV